MKYSFVPQGVCPRKLEIELDGDRIVAVEFTGGCHGNLQGVSRLVAGMTVQDAAGKLKGIRCGMKPTSCPDQLSLALCEALRQEEKAALVRD